MNVQAPRLRRLGTGQTVLILLGPSEASQAGRGPRTTGAGIVVRWMRWYPRHGERICRFEDEPGKLATASGIFVASNTCSWASTRQ